MKYLKGFSILVVIGLAFSAILYAQSEEILLNHSSQFDSQRRKSVLFQHELHMEYIDCLGCHHDFKDGENVLDEADLEEGNPATECATCHEIDSRCDLQDVYHDFCMGCHISMQKSGQTSGPRLCAGCHSAESKGDPANLSSLFENSSGC